MEWQGTDCLVYGSQARGAVGTHIMPAVLCGVMRGVLHGVLRGVLRAVVCSAVWCTVWCTVARTEVLPGWTPIRRGAVVPSYGKSA